MTQHIAEDCILFGEAKQKWKYNGGLNCFWNAGFDLYLKYIWN